MYIENKFDTELASFDLNNDGIFSGIEVTPEQEGAMHNVTSDTGRNLAPFTGAIFSFMYFFVTWALFTLITWLHKQYAIKNT